MRNLEIPTRLLLCHFKWCYTTSYGVKWCHTVQLDGSFLLHNSERVPQTLLKGEDPWNHKANKQIRQPIVFLPHLRYNLFEVQPGPYKRILAASVYIHVPCKDTGCRSVCSTGTEKSIAWNI
jgi:hypothetical protein